jgi:multicomponent Na+:H+ antiporter subunit G
LALSAWICAALVVAGLSFFLGGTLGLLRFPDVYNRLHALTKADNVGLGLVVAGLSLQDFSILSAAKLILVWLLMLVASTTVCHLIARTALHDGTAAWRES